MREPLTRFLIFVLLLQSFRKLLQPAHFRLYCLLLMLQSLYLKVETIDFPAQLLIPILFSLIIASILLLCCRQFLQLPLQPRLIIPSLLLYFLPCLSLDPLHLIFQILIFLLDLLVLLQQMG